MDQEPPEEVCGGAGGGVVGAWAGMPRPWPWLLVPWLLVPWLLVPWLLVPWLVPGAWLPGACDVPPPGAGDEPVPDAGDELVRGICDEPAPRGWAGVDACVLAGFACPGTAPANAAPSTAEAPVALAATPSVIARVRPVTRWRCSAARKDRDVPYTAPRRRGSSSSIRSSGHGMP